MAHAPVSFFPVACSSPRSTKAWSGPCLSLILLLRTNCIEGNWEESEELDMLKYRRKWQGKR